MAKKNSNLYLLTRLSVVLSVVLLAVGVFFFGPLPSVKAASCGDEQVGGSSWNNASGVAVRYNGTNDGTGTDCWPNSPNGHINPYQNINPPNGYNQNYPQMGDGWQCVELVQRFYATRGWTSGVFSHVGVAADIYTYASNNGWSTMAQGSITLANIVPGDMLVTHEGGGVGHVMAVDSISGNTIHTVDQNGLDGGRTNVTFSSGSLSDGSYFQFSGVVHSPNNTGNGAGGGSASTPSSVARDSNNMAVFYSDASNKLVNYSWNSGSGWSTQSWTDTGLVYGQPAVVSRTSDSMDVFYYTGEHKLVTKGWTASGGWTGPTALLSGGVYGDPAVVARDSSDMQVFYRTNNTEIKSIYWSASGGWNTNPQNLYTSGATTDPTATTRGTDNMEVFFGKNNGNLVHLGWSSEYGWATGDYSAGNGVTGKPSAISRDGGGKMSAYYQETAPSGGYSKVGEESWYWVTGWAQQDWSAQLAGSPSAIVGVSNVIDDFYRETGGNIVDRYFTGSAWLTTNIAGSSSATGNPNVINRGTTNMEVFYWNGVHLIDDNYNTGSGSWSASQIN